MPKTCEIDDQDRKIWKERYDWQVEPCILLKVIEGFDPSKCPVREHCQEMVQNLRDS